MSEEHLAAISFAVALPKQPCVFPSGPIHNQSFKRGMPLQFRVNREQ